MVDVAISRSERNLENAENDKEPGLKRPNGKRCKQQQQIKWPPSSAGIEKTADRKDDPNYQKNAMGRQEAFNRMGVPLDDHRNETAKCGNN